MTKIVEEKELGAVYSEPMTLGPDFGFYSFRPISTMEYTVEEEDGKFYRFNQNLWMRRVAFYTEDGSPRGLVSIDNCQTKEKDKDWKPFNLIHNNRLFYVDEDEFFVQMSPKNVLRRSLEKSVENIKKNIKSFGIKTNNLGT